MFASKHLSIECQLKDGDKNIYNFYFYFINTEHYKFINKNKDRSQINVVSFVVCSVVCYFCKSPVDEQF